jgi:hypothetical protein
MNAEVASVLSRAAKTAVQFALSEVRKFALSDRYLVFAVLAHVAVNTRQDERCGFAPP